MAYPKELMDKALSILSQRRADARRAASAHREEIAQKLPQVIAIEQELARTSVQVSRAILSGENLEKKLAALRDGNLALQAKRADLLVENGYPANYLEVNYQCAQCGDTGFCDNHMCDCLRSLLKQLAYARMGEVSDIGNCKFENFSLDYYPAPGPRKVMGEILSLCREYAAGFSLKSESLLMMGGTGLGKTHLSLAIARAVIDQGFDVFYIPVQNLMSQLEHEKFSRSGDEKDSLSFVLEADLLILDDLGAEFPTQFTSATIYNIINSRMIEGRPTIINSNLDMKTIEARCSERTVSRLIGGYKILPFAGTDIRVLKKQQSR